MSEDSSACSDFGPLRRLIWPIYRHEMKKLIPMLLMFFFITFNYNVLRTMKDTLVVTAKSSGAEVIPFIKVWVMFPGAVAMTLLYSCLTNWLSREKVFYFMISIFLLYFFLFAFVLYPNRDFLHPNDFADYLQYVLPKGCKGFVAMLRHWTFTIFYVMSELWGNIVFSVLIWGFANQVTSFREARRFYAIFGFGANVSGIIAGQVSVFLCSRNFSPNIPLGTNAWEQSMLSLIVLILLSGVITLILFRYLHLKVLNKEEKTVDHPVEVNQKKKGKKLSLRESFSYLFNSKYLLYIAIIVISYNIVINLIEVVWKDQLRALYPSPKDYNLYINQVSSIIGVLATFAALFVSGNVFRRFGWASTAIATPIVLLITGAVFFGTIFSKEYFSNSAAMLFGMSPLSLVVLVGAVGNILSRGAKYTVFDETKEIAFVPLSTECKTKGKAVIDGICNRLGKSGGSMIHQSLLLLFGTFSASAPYVAAIMLATLIGWMAAVRLLGREFNQLTADSKSHSVSTPDENSSVDAESGETDIALYRS